MQCRFDKVFWKTATCEKDALKATIRFTLSRVTVKVDNFEWQPMKQRRVFLLISFVIFALKSLQRLSAFRICCFNSCSLSESVENSNRRLCKGIFARQTQRNQWVHLFFVFFLLCWWKVCLACGCLLLSIINPFLSECKHTHTQRIKFSWNLFCAESFVKPCKNAVVCVLCIFIASPEYGTMINK